MTEAVRPASVSVVLPMKLSGLEFTESELKAMVESANQNLTRYEEQRAVLPEEGM